jgi:hypothetical protein
MRAAISSAVGFGAMSDRRNLTLKAVFTLARSYMNLSPVQLFKQANRAKIREYRERICEAEHGDFNSLFSYALEQWPLNAAQ